MKLNSLEVDVKKLSIFLFIALLLIGTISAQNRNNHHERGDSQNRNNPQNSYRTVTIEGTIKMQRGLTAVESGDSVYYVPLLTRYIGFIDELKEGAKVSVAGYEFRNFIHPTKVTIEGKPYDFTAGVFGNYFGRNFDQNRNYGQNAPNRAQGPNQNIRPDRNFNQNRNNYGSNRNNQIPNRSRQPQPSHCCCCRR